jgi:hypothetical protein
VEERGERSWERSWQDLEHARFGSPLLPLSLKFLNNVGAGVLLGAVMVILLGMGARF